jgi:hypothetical protein
MFATGDPHKVATMGKSVAVPVSQHRILQYLIPNATLALRPDGLWEVASYRRDRTEIDDDGSNIHIRESTIILGAHRCV